MDLHEYNPLSLKSRLINKNKDFILPKLPQGSIGHISFSKSDRYMQFSVDGDRSPKNMFVLNLKNKVYRQITNSNNSRIPVSDLVESKVITYDSFDGLKIPANLYRP